MKRGPRRKVIIDNRELIDLSDWEISNARHVLIKIGVLNYLFARKGQDVWYNVDSYEIEEFKSDWFPNFSNISREKQFSSTMRSWFSGDKKLRPGISSIVINFLNRMGITNSNTSPIVGHMIGHARVALQLRLGNALKKQQYQGTLDRKKWKSGFLWPGGVFDGFRMDIEDPDVLLGLFFIFNKENSSKAWLKGGTTLYDLHRDPRRWNKNYSLEPGLDKRQTALFRLQLLTERAINNILGAPFDDDRCVPVIIIPPRPKDKETRDELKRQYEKEGGLEKGELDKFTWKEIQKSIGKSSVVNIPAPYNIIRLIEMYRYLFGSNPIKSLPNYTDMCQEISKASKNGKLPMFWKLNKFPELPVLTKTILPVDRWLSIRGIFKKKSKVNRLIGTSEIIDKAVSDIKIIIKNRNEYIAMSLLSVEVLNHLRFRSYVRINEPVEEKTRVAIIGINEAHRLLSDNEGWIIINDIRIITKVPDWVNNHLEEIKRIVEEYEGEQDVDNFAALVEWESLLNDITRLSNKEQRMFGRKGIVAQDILILVDAITREAAGARRRFDKNTKYPMMKHLSELDIMKEKYQKLSMEQEELGRRCRNEEDFFTFEDVDDISERDFIRLESGACWDIGSLIEHLKGVMGENTSENLIDYPSGIIWEDEEELQRILTNPVSIEEGFTTWYHNRTLIESAEIISEETLDMMYRAASILASTGAPFQDVILDELNKEQLEAWNKAGHASWGLEGEIGREVEVIIRILLKSDAANDMWYYYEKLDEKEKKALGEFDKELEKNLSKCIVKEYCVFGMSNQLITTRNIIARVKGLPVLNL